MWLAVAKDSLISRKGTVFLTFLSLTVSLLVLFSVEHIRAEAKSSFTRAVAGTDLIVGAPSGQLNLLLYSMFRLGSPTNSIKYASFKALENDRQVEWAIPISLGDSHKGFRVLGTTNAYFEHYRYGGKQSLAMAEGKRFSTLFEAVIGAQVAESLGYRLNDKIVIAHGIGATSFQQHDRAPFTIVGILARTGTPVDKTVHIGLNAIEAIHLPPRQLAMLAENENAIALSPTSISAVMLGLKSKLATFALQRQINNYTDDRLMAVLPGVAMAELWSIVSVLETTLQIVAALVLLSALFCLSTMLLASMNERRHEMAILRVLGAGPRHIVLLIMLEALLIAVAALFTATVLLSALLITAADTVSSQFGIFLSTHIVSAEYAYLSGGVLLATAITATLPCYKAYRRTLNHQL